MIYFHEYGEQLAFCYKRIRNNLLESIKKIMYKQIYIITIYICIEIGINVGA